MQSTEMPNHKRPQQIVVAVNLEEFVGCAIDVATIGASSNRCKNCAHQYSFLDEKKKWHKNVRRKNGIKM